MGTEFGNDRLIETLEKRGEQWVRQQMLEGLWAPGTLNHGRVTVWLETKDAERRDAKDEESLSISRRALRNSNWANIIAAIATVLSVIAIIIAAMQYIKG